MDSAHEENRQKDLRRVGFSKTKLETDVLEVEEDEEFDNEMVIVSNRNPPTEREYCFSHPPQLIITDVEPQLYNGCDCSDSSALSSRRPSAIIAALRRPSQAVALSAAQAVMNQRRYLLGLSNENTPPTSAKDNKKGFGRRRFINSMNYEGFTIILSALYAKLLVVLGMAFPITEVITAEVKPFYYQGFYLYLYLGSITFIIYEYVSLITEKAVKHIIEHYDDVENGTQLQHKYKRKSSKKYGSFYLRLGAIAFGIGSMVYSGLEFGRYFELKNIPECSYTALQAITPATRMVLTMLQIQFIFLNHGDVDVNRHKVIGRFGLMHMIAANLCEWLYVLVEETKHEIIHLSEHSESGNSSTFGSKYCTGGYVMGSLVNNASPFLFPCTIEYSLICAVILFEMWKHMEKEDEEKHSEPKKHKNRVDPFEGGNSGYHFTIDCTNSHRGLFAGITVIVLTIISLVMFFVLTGDLDESGVRNHYAEMEVNFVELFLYVTTTISVIVAMFQLRNLKYERKIGHGGLGLDNTLLAVSQTGMFIYSMFSIIGWYFTINGRSPVAMVADTFSFIQTCLQTMFVLDAWWRRCKNLKQARTKPGRELITFLIIANMAMWTINSLEKNRAEFRPTHLKFFGDWGWTIITHISMPLAIFYRFHSTICLFEVWKTAYKIKSSFKNPLFPVM
ncbi:proton channel OtopLc-like [Sitophilus oryzae]|uniref:Proton channel OtopLc-like n=1 Tax=Sitophilus oryzae TaxID=7048 RepID=A0A6J2XJE5_SITOR|nr:proton channel OtopLc-like [Sitophilus oryzae]